MNPEGQSNEIHHTLDAEEVFDHIEKNNIPVFKDDTLEEDTKIHDLKNLRQVSENLENEVNHTVENINLQYDDLVRKEGVINEKFTDLIVQINSDRAKLEKIREKITLLMNAPVRPPVRLVREDGRIIETAEDFNSERIKAKEKEEESLKQEVLKNENLFMDLEKELFKIRDSIKVIENFLYPDSVPRAEFN